MWVGNRKRIAGHSSVGGGVFVFHLGRPAVDTLGSLNKDSWSPVYQPKEALVKVRDTFHKLVDTHVHHPPHPTPPLLKPEQRPACHSTPPHPFQTNGRRATMPPTWRPWAR